MTCIVGLVDKINKSVYIGADSASIAGDNMSIRTDLKAFKVDDFIIGCTSSFRMIQLLRYSLKLKPIGDKDIFEYMCTDFINAVRKCFKKGGYMTINSNEELGGQFLVGYKDRLFMIDSDFQVAENRNGYDSVGSGSLYALGALHYAQTVTSELQTDQKVKNSLEAADFHSSSVSGPFYILTT